MNGRKVLKYFAVVLLVTVSMLFSVVYAEESFIDTLPLQEEYDNTDFVFEADSEKIIIGQLVSDVYLVTASYDDGKLVDALYKPVSRKNSFSEMTYNQLGLDVDGADTIKAFILSDMSDVRPLCVVRRAFLNENDIHEAYQLIYNAGDFTTGLVGSKDGVHESMDSGWVLDNRGGIPRLSIEDVVSEVRDISKTEPVALVKELNFTHGEKLVAEFKCKSGGEGSFVGFYDDEKLAVCELKNIDNEWCILGKDGEYTPLFDVTLSKAQSFRIYLDQNKMTAEIYIDNVYCTKTELLSDNIMSFSYGIDEENVATIKPGITDVVANYGVYETFDIFGIDEIYGWNADGNVSVSDKELVLSDSAVVTKSFDKIDTKYVAQMQLILPEAKDAGFEIKSGNFVCVAAESKDGSFFVNGKKVYEKITPDMWYRIRIEANPGDGRALVYVNGRNMGYVLLKGTNPIDNIEIVCRDGNVRFDNIYVYANPEYDDYVPQPETKADLSDYIVGINVCSLWRDNGSHFGWACVTPYDENRPLIGYYDEGNPETADWEIKFMVEHGIDVQAFCWYADVNEGPLKNPRNGYQLYDAFKYAKYKDYMKYCIIWECSSSNYGSEQFRNYVVPFWFENYFLDSNYLVLDNKIVLSSFGISNMCGERGFGSVENARAELDYLEEVALSYGFDGIIFLGGDTMGLLDDLCADGRVAYHWLEAGCEFEATKNMNEATNAISDTVYQVPTVSCGYNDIAWMNSYGRSPLMTVEDYDKCFDWVKNEYIPVNAEKGTWQEKLVWLSTWNEYGEGTYIMPSGLNGFGYLDVLREYFTELEEDHEDPLPTKNQAMRINRLYPQYSRYLRRLQSVEYNTLNPEYETVYRFVPTAEITKVLKAENIVYDGNGLTATSNQIDFNVLFVEAMRGINLDEVDAVKLELKVPAGSSPTVYFTTETSTEQSGYKSVNQLATTSQMKEYIFDFSKNSSWKGYLKLLRIDPAESSNVTFTLKSVEFLKNKTRDEYEVRKSQSPKLYVNELLVDSYILPENKNGKTLFPFDPEMSIHNRLHTFMTWNHDEKVLTLEADGHKAVFTVGSDEYVSDGEKFDLGYTLYQTDGLPMLDYEALCNALGFGYSFDEEENRVDVVTDEYDMYEKIANPIPGYWEFDTYDVEGWRTATSSISVDSGCLVFDNLTAGHNDPSLFQKTSGLGFSIPEYDTLEFRIRYSHEGENKQLMSFYFMTAEDADFSEKKVAYCSQKIPNESNGWETYTINLADETSWGNKQICTGEITAIRFDPFNVAGKMEIDYIRFYKSE